MIMYYYNVNFLFALAYVSSTRASKQDALAPVPAEQQHPLVTPAPASTHWRPTRTLRRRGLVDDIKSNVNSVLTDLGSAIPSYVASGVPNFFQDFPNGERVRDELQLDDDQIRALPTQVLNVPSVRPQIFGACVEN